MKYVYIKEREKREDRVAEMRMNLREVHNKYCEQKDFSKSTSAIDLMQYGNSQDEKTYKLMLPFREIAVLLEGIEEMYEESSDNVFFEAIEELNKKMIQEQERV